jgi:hypothetical protein
MRARIMMGNAAGKVENTEIFPAETRMQASKIMQIRVHPGFHQIVRRAASDRFCDLSDYVRQALRERLERDGYNLAPGVDGAMDGIATATES